jgi:pimeloyl-ACP methyl ester carboxylesterase
MRVMKRRVWTLMLLLSIAAMPTVAQAQAATPASDYTGHWEGAIEIPGMKMTIQVDLAFSEDAWSGTIDIPQQGAAGIALTAIETNDAGIAFAITGVPGDPTFRGALSDGELKGEFTQGGQGFPFTLARGETPPPPRPQEPKPPFPYEEEEVSYTNGEITLSGTLTFPSEGRPFPAAILITGSGPQDRDETLLGHKPFLVLADHLTRAGIAVLRVDDRGVGGSTGSNSESTTMDFATDVRAGISFLSGHAEIDPGKIGLIGHSEGGVVAPLVAADSENVAFVIMMAGTGVTGREVLAHQNRLIARAAGASETAIDGIVVELEKAIDLIVAEADEQALSEQIGALLVAQGVSLPAEERDAAIASAMEQMTSPWFRTFFLLDPRVALRRMKSPVLVINGSKDLQVDAEQNIPEIRKALEESGNDDVTIEVLEGLNHLFQQAETGAPGEYFTIEETINPVALERMSGWITERFLSAAPMVE